MLDLWGLATAGAAFFIVAASPGPATLALATVSMRSGRRNGFRFGLGLSAGLAFWGLLAATGLGAMLQASSHVLMALKVLGGAYLLWLACSSARSACQETGSVAFVRSHGAWFKRGLFLNLSNPKAVVAWMATLTLGVGNNNAILQVVLATSLCAGLGFLIYGVYAFVFSTAGAMKGYGRLRRWIDGVVAGLFALAGAALIRSAFAR